MLNKTNRKEENSFTDDYNELRSDMIHNHNKSNKHKMHKNN